MLVADRIAELLQREGAEFVVGFPENRLLDSASLIGMRPIITRTERVAVNIADGFARATNGERIAALRDAVRPRRRGRVRRRRPGVRRPQPDPALPERARRRRAGHRAGCAVEEAYRPITRFAATLNGADARPGRVPPRAERAARRAQRPGAGGGRQRRAERRCRRCRLVGRARPAAPVARPRRDDVAETARSAGGRGAAGDPGRPGRALRRRDRRAGRARRADRYAGRDDAQRQERLPREPPARRSAPPPAPGRRPSTSSSSRPT